MDTHEMIHPAVRERSGCPSGVRIVVKANTRKTEPKKRTELPSAGAIRCLIIGLQAQTQRAHEFFPIVRVWAGMKLCHCIIPDQHHSGMDARVSGTPLTDCNITASVPLIRYSGSV